jgi:hypothetical protein
MARRKPYRLSTLFLDVFLTLLTGGVWLIVVGFREYRHHNR